MIYENKSDMNCDDHFFIFISFHISLTKNTLCAKNFPSLCITRNFSMCTATLRDISTLHVTSYKMSLMIIVICPIHTYPDIFENILSPF